MAYSSLNPPNEECILIVEWDQNIKNEKINWIESRNLELVMIKYLIKKSRYVELINYI